MKMLEGVIFMPSGAQRNCSILEIDSKMTQKSRKWSSYGSLAKIIFEAKIAFFQF